MAGDTFAWSDVNPGPEKHFSYHAAVKYQDETFLIHNVYERLPPLCIEAILEEPQYSGNLFLPFYKSFKTAYQCNFAPQSRQATERCEATSKAR